MAMVINLPDQIEKALMALRLEVSAAIVDPLRELIAVGLETEIAKANRRAEAAEKQLAEAKEQAKDGRERAMTKINRLRETLEGCRKIAYERPEGCREDYDLLLAIRREIDAALESEATSPSPDEDLDKALKLIWKRYRNDLPAFFRDAYAEYQKGKSDWA